MCTILGNFSGALPVATLPKLLTKDSYVIVGGEVMKVMPVVNAGEGTIKYKESIGRVAKRELEKN